MWLVNGVDDNQSGYVDEQWDGVDNDLNGKTDYMDDGGFFSPNPWETEAENWVGLERDPNRVVTSLKYTIERRPAPSQGAREVVLPAGTYIDMTTGIQGQTHERSRLPVYPSLPYVDVMLNPSGQVVPTTIYASPATFGLDASYYHFWIAEREDLHEPVDKRPTLPYMLPMPADAPGFPAVALGDQTWGTSPLRGDNRLLTLYTRTGNIVVNKVTAAQPNPLAPEGTFPFLPGFVGPQTGFPGTTSIDNPFVGAELGLKETP